MEKSLKKSRAARAMKAIDDHKNQELTLDLAQEK